MSAYGIEVGNCGITFIPTRGLYVAGRLTPKNIDWIAKKDGDRSARETVFGRAFWDKGEGFEVVGECAVVCGYGGGYGVEGCEGLYRTGEWMMLGVLLLYIYIYFGLYSIYFVSHHTVPVMT